MSTVIREGMDEEEEKEIDAKIDEIDMLLDQLQKRKHDLEEAKRSLEEGKLYAATPPLTTYSGRGEQASSAQERVLDSLRWREFGPEKAGQWAFVNDRSGNLMKELEPVRDLVKLLKEGKQLNLGKHRYKISENGKFMNRFPVTPTQSHPTSR